MGEKKILEKFLLESEEFEKIKHIMSEPNIFEVLGVEKNENRHSNILAWLFNPNASHHIEDLFLRTFLKKLVTENDSLLDIDIFDIEMFDFDDVEVRREWNRIDILLISKKNKLVIAIENKIDSTEHDNQLERYYKIINKSFNSFKKVFVYLTREGETPSDDDWLIFDYSLVLGILEHIIEYREDSMSDNLLNIMNQYKIILRRYIVGNSEIEEICRGIYKKHKKALDLIFEYKPDANQEISKFIQDKIKSNSNLVLDNSSKSYIRFTTESLDLKVPNLGKGWSNSKRILLFEFQNRENKLQLCLIIGPGDLNTRENLRDIARGKLKLFSLANRSMGKKFFSIYKKEFLSKKNFEDLTVDDLKVIVDQKFSDFMENDLGRIENVILSTYDEKLIRKSNQ